MFNLAAAASLGIEAMGKFKEETEVVTWEGRDEAYLLLAMLLNIARGHCTEEESGCAC